MTFDRVRIYEYLYGKETMYLTLVNDMQTQFRYSPKPERIEEGLKVFWLCFSLFILLIDLIWWFQIFTHSRKFQASPVWLMQDSFQISDIRLGNVAVRMYEPLTRETNGPAVMFYHGGGWVMGSVGQWFNEPIQITMCNFIDSKWIYYFVQVPTMEQKTS